MTDDRMSTSAKLRETQGALAKSQQDLTAMQADRDRLAENETRWAAEFEYAERERDEALGRVADLLEDVAWQKQVVGMLRENEEIRAQVIRERNRERDLLRAELVTATAELGQLREGDLQSRLALESAHEELEQLRTYVATLERALTNTDTAHEAEIATLRAQRRPFHDGPPSEVDRPVLAWMERQRAATPQQPTTEKEAP